MSCPSRNARMARSRNVGRSRLRPMTKKVAFCRDSPSKSKMRPAPSDGPSSKVRKSLCSGSSVLPSVLVGSGAGTSGDVSWFLSRFDDALLSSRAFISSSSNESHGERPTTALAAKNRNRLRESQGRSLKVKCLASFAYSCHPNLLRYSIF
jgi:hypothetical protein